MSYKKNLLVQKCNIDGIHSFLAFLFIVFHLIVFTDLVNQAGAMHKNVCAGVLWFDKSETFGLIEKFYCSLHCIIIKIKKNIFNSVKSSRTSQTLAKDLKTVNKKVEDK
jgi:hypothetical protein